MVRKGHNSKISSDVCGYLLVLMLVSGMFLQNCRTSADDPRVIEFWAMGVEARYLAEIVSLFEKENPDIKVRIQAIPWSAAHEKLLTAYAGHSTPDLCQLGNTWIPEFIILNAIEPLDEYIKNSGIITKDYYFPGIWATNVINEELFGIPWYVDTRLLFYRKDIFGELGYSTPPTTWNELFELSLNIREQKKTDYAFYLPLNGWHEIVILAMQNGVNFLRENNSCGDFNTPEFQTALQFYLKLYEYQLCPLGMNAVSNLYQSFADDYFSIYISGPWNLVEFEKRLPESMQDKWAVAPLPSFTEEYPGVSTAGGSSIVMFRNSQNKAECWKLIEFLSLPEIQARFYRLSGDLPTNTEAWSIAGLHENEKTRAFYQQLQHVQPTPKIPEWEQIALKIQQHVEAMVYGDMSPEEVGEQLNIEVDRLLEKRRWLLGRK